MTVTAVLKRMGVDDVTVHGFRSSFRTWAAESNGRYRSDIAEAALAHMTKDKVLAAYQRGELFGLRVSMMADWAHFLLPGGFPCAAVARPARHGEGDPRSAAPEERRAS